MVKLVPLFYIELLTNKSYFCFHFNTIKELLKEKKNYIVDIFNIRVHGSRLSLYEQVVSNYLILFPNVSVKYLI